MAVPRAGRKRGVCVLCVLPHLVCVLVQEALVCSSAHLGARGCVEPEELAGVGGLWGGWGRAGKSMC